jgi:hypothetical protein
VRSVPSLLPELVVFLRAEKNGQDREESRMLAARHSVHLV